MRNYLLFFFLLLFLSQQICFAQSAIRETKMEKARAYIQNLQQKLGVPGVSVAVGMNDKLVWAEGFGYADQAKATPVTPQSIFRVGSISKTLTAAAVGLLYDKGKLDLDAPIQRYVPYFPEKKYPITLRQLGGHQAGIRHYKDFSEALNTRHYASVPASLTLIAPDTLLFEPGTQEFYSSYGYNLIAAAIEGASGKDYLTFIQEEIFKKLKMQHTLPDKNDSTLANKVTFYHFMMPGKRILAPPIDVSDRWASGGFLSTPTDLVQFVQQLPTLLKPKTIALLTTPQHLKNGAATNYAIGWRSEIIDPAKTRTAIHHGGAITGGRAFLFYLPKEKVVVAFTANALVDFAQKEAYELAKIFLGEE